MIQQISAEFNIDPDRVYVIGVSNGGFMSYRLACDFSEIIAGKYIPQYYSHCIVCKIQIN